MGVVPHGPDDGPQMGETHLQGWKRRLAYEQLPRSTLTTISLTEYSPKPLSSTVAFDSMTIYQHNKI